VIIEDGETTVVRETSVDSGEPVDWLSVNLVTRRVVYNSVLTARLCSHNASRGLTKNRKELLRSIIEIVT